mgnify:CR=1 FL=1|tara:strand:+ start:4248 stop:4640 length:393 start_codon:yes stop_codon:yes gene_type:complete
MPTLTLTFSEPIQVSVQVGDMVYFAPSITNNAFGSGHNTNINNEQIEIGPCTAIAANRLSLDVTFTTGNPIPGQAPYGTAADHFIFFSKDKASNPSGLIGYYMKVRMKTNLKTAVSELFSVGSDVFESSK